MYKINYNKTDKEIKGEIERLINKNKPILYTIQNYPLEITYVINN